MENVSNLVKAWFANADEDFRGAIALHNLDPTRYLRLVPYHCQQAVEKSLKGYLSFKGVKFEKNHHISCLTKLMLPTDQELEKALKEAAVLTVFAIQFRYPNTAMSNPTMEDSKFSIRIAKIVCDKIRSLIPLDGSRRFEFRSRSRPIYSQRPRFRRLTDLFSGRHNQISPLISPTGAPRNEC